MPANASSLMRVRGVVGVGSERFTEGREAGKRRQPLEQISLTANITHQLAEPASVAIYFIFIFILQVKQK